MSDRSLKECQCTILQKLSKYKQKYDALRDLSMNGFQEVPETPEMG